MAQELAERAEKAKTITETVGWLPGTVTWGWQCGPAAPRGAVLLASGFGEERKCGLRLLTATGRRLAAAGYLVLRLDLRGVGDSGGDHATVTGAEWRADVARATAYLAAAQAGPVYGLGARLGGNLLLAEPGLAGVVAWEPLPSGADYLDELSRRRAIKQASGGGGSGERDFDGYVVSDGLAATMRELDLQRQLGEQLDRPLKLIHVTGARQPFGHWQKIAETISAPHEFLLLRQRPFWGRIDTEPREELLRATLDFIDAVAAGHGPA